MRVERKPFGVAETRHLPCPAARASVILDGIGEIIGSTAMKIYLAGPEVFLPDADHIGHLKREICKRFGFEGLFPLDANPPDDSKGEPLSRRIFRANTGLMDEADAIIANLTPFRGPSADVGTVYELAYMLGRGSRLCFGDSNIADSYIDKVRKQIEVRADGAGGFRDADGLAVEDFGLPDNLMIIHGLELFGCPLVVPSRSAADPFRELSSFEECVRTAARRIEQPPAMGRSRVRSRS